MGGRVDFNLGVTGVTEFHPAMAGPESHVHMRLWFYMISLQATYSPLSQYGGNKS